uniref:EF-hand domain-containing protein n=1 Tax=Anas zonorhyncha TaxID=75864 RepID=A0A8C0A008_9AVES
MLPLFFQQAFTIMDQNRDGFIDKADLRDTFAALGRLNVKNEELEDMVKEAPGPINFTVFLTMFGEKLKGKYLWGIGEVSVKDPQH